MVVLMIAESTISRGVKKNRLFLDLEHSEVLSEISVDEFDFKVALHPWLDGRCVLWFRDIRSGSEFEALGHFTNFDKRGILFFISRYATSADLRAEIEHRRFERRVDGLTRDFFAQIERMSRGDKTVAFRSLFNLDAEVEPDTLARRRRTMVRKFHPDAGGDNATMSLINAAYDHLVSTTTK